MKILVTGSSGFIGRNLVEYLSERGYDVVGIDIVKSETAYYIIDITKEDSIEELVRLNPDAIIHLAAYANPRAFSEAGAFNGLKLNVNGTTNMLEVARRSNARFVLFSTANVYGKPRRLPVREDDPLTPFDGYGWSKLAAEASTMAYHVTHGVFTVIFRLWKPYGPHDRGVVGTFITRALRGEDIIVNNGGADSTDFIYITDVCRATELAILKDGISGQVFNIGFGAEVTILDLARRIVELTGSNSRIVIRPITTEPLRSYPDVSKAKALLGFEAQVRLEDGLKMTIEWFKKRLGL